MRDLQAPRRFLELFKWERETGQNENALDSRKAVTPRGERRRGGVAVARSPRWLCLIWGGAEGKKESVK